MVEKKSTLTLSLKAGYGEMLKPGELIEISDASALTLQDRRVYNFLVHKAFGPRMGEPDADFKIPLSELRGSHCGNERLEDSIERLMRTVVRIRLPDGQVRRVQLLGGNDMGDSSRERGYLTYSFDKRLSEILRTSTTFGKLELAVMVAMTSSYGLALYEWAAKRVRLREKFTEELTLDELRDVLGIAPGQYPRWPNIRQRCLDPAIEEINALAPFSISVVPMKEGRKVAKVALGWWMKDEDEMRNAYAELKRPKVGRRARIRGGVDEVIA
jgi:hypothetical protein